MSAKHGTHSRYSQGCRCDARTDDYSLLQCWQAITSIRCQFAPLRSTFVAVTRAPHVRGGGRYGVNRWVVTATLPIDLIHSRDDMARGPTEFKSSSSN
jgi:hypothetical protein